MLVFNLNSAYIQGWSGKPEVVTDVVVLTLISPFSTAVPTWGQSTLIPSGSSPKRDCGTIRVEAIGVAPPRSVVIIPTIVDHYKTYPILLFRRMCLSCLSCRVR